MSSKGINWPGLLCCSLLHGIIFMVVRYQLVAGHSPHAQYGLLLFLVPGALAAQMSKNNPLTVMLLAMLFASPPCLILMQFTVFKSVGLWQEIALISSAVFWCGLGTMIVMLWRSMLASAKGH